MDSVENTGIYLAHNYPDHPGISITGFRITGFRITGFRITGFRITEGPLTSLYKQTKFVIRPQFACQQTDWFEMKLTFGPYI
jgi:hypothetical protein